MGALSRRDLLKRLIVLILSLFTAGSLGLFFSLYPFRERRKKLEFFPVLPAEDAPRKGVKRLKVPAVIGGKRVEIPAFLVATDDGIVALSSRCTHLGCFVAWDGNRGEFICPCHGGRYDMLGRVVGGPPPAPLEKLPLRLEKGFLLVGSWV